MPMTRSSYSYAVFRYVKDAKRDLSVPVGVAVWSQDHPWVGIRFISSNERVPGISKNEDYPYIDFVKRKIDSWLSTGSVPYLSEPVRNYTDRWWRQVRAVLVHKVRLSEPRSIDCSSPEREIDLLFKDLVRGVQQGATRGRVDHLVSKCLGDLTKKFEHEPVLGFAGKPVKVMRRYVGTDAIVVVEGINLAIDDAPDAADALVGRLQRARADGEAHTARRVLAVVGYMATAEGLNGEAYLKRWIEERGDAQAFDIQHQGAELRQVAQRALDEAGPPPVFSAAD